ncbi:hypothetical protein EL18_02548 [Nitratireductor basaltis]|uniref:Uncharacterized protein n=1 Tax=Nitratireductor basaltis TaxID=472175 RepID=A0A084U5R3_9HYPH|nr:hypothetical protein EL18_02548 [Nitratireductor basaltis]
MRKRDRIALAYFEAVAITEGQTWPNHYWYSSITNCDVCSKPMGTERFMIDGPAESGPNARWGNMCVVCAHRYARVIDWGRAQLYEKDAAGHWKLISGGPPQ